jgi:hypothetical protein
MNPQDNNFDQPLPHDDVADILGSTSRTTCDCVCPCVGRSAAGGGGGRVGEGGAHYYVYALKDPCSSPARPFLVGKGVGPRAWDHERRNAATKHRIAKIKQAGHQPLVTIVFGDLTEIEALKREAELISVYGTEASGGLLTNSVMPTGKRRKKRNSVTVPLGAPEKAQLGVSLLNDAVLELAQANDKGVTNSDVCHALGLHSDYRGGSQDFLSYSILGVLMKTGKLKRKNIRRRGYHFAQVR